MRNDIMNFVVLRGPETPDPTETIKIPKEYGGPLKKDLEKNKQESSVDEYTDWARRKANDYVASDTFVARTETLDLPFSELKVRLEQEEESVALHNWVRSNIDPESDTYQSEKERLIDSYIAASIAGKQEARAELAQGLRLFDFIERAHSEYPPETLPQLNRPLVLPDGLIPGASRAPRRRSSQEVLEAAKAELQNLSFNELKTEIEVDDGDNRHEFLVLPMTTIGNLSSSTAGLIDEADSRRLDDVLGYIASKMTGSAPIDEAGEDSQGRVINYNGNIIKVSPMRSSPNKATRHDDEVASDKFIFPKYEPAKPYRVLGIGELMVLQEVLQHYELGEVAHIENVLAGEHKERVHRRLKRTEDRFITETETETTEERDLRTAERFELESEISKTVQKQWEFEAGVNISAQYGTVKADANTRYATDQAREESRRTASRFAREITEKALSRIRERTFERRETVTIVEVEETNTHGIDNAGQGGEHVTGIYRYLNKVYEAQVVNYGNRLMLEFIVPKPAAFLINQLGRQADEQSGNLQPPPPFTFKPKSITEDTYHTLVRRYNVTDVEAPPPKFVTSSTEIKMQLERKEFKSDVTYHSLQVISSESAAVKIPEGYAADEAYIVGAFIDINSVAGHEECNVAVGKHLVYLNGLDRNNNKTIKMNEETGELAIGVTSTAGWEHTVVITIKCKRTNKHLEQWKLATHTKILNAYLARKAEYEDKLAEARMGDDLLGIEAQSENPEQNRRTERTELKRSCLAMLMQDADLDVHDYRPFVTDSGHIRFDRVANLRERGDEILFFETAFEWEQMTYIFYPYFWGQQNRDGDEDSVQWDLLQPKDNADPIHLQFLQAGAARVVVPVSLEFEEDIMHYVQHGEIWQGEEPPRLEDGVDERYIPIVEELKDRRGQFGEEKARGEPFEVRVPTSLVILQKEPMQFVDPLVPESDGDGRGNDS